LRHTFFVLHRAETSLLTRIINSGLLHIHGAKLPDLPRARPRILQNLLIRKQHYVIRPRREGIVRLDSAYAQARCPVVIESSGVE
jgi:hypothetical protein